jgi:uncharacterized glyoxalase superfamily protein PhnB
MSEQITLDQLNVIVKDMDATVAFYRRLGLDVEAEPKATHVSITFDNGFLLEFDTMDMAQAWDTGWHGATGGSTVLGFAIDSRDRVDGLYAELTAAGYHGRQPPYDAFWGARYAIVEDPDGNGVGLMSPVDKERKFWPPKAPPKAMENG